MNNEAESSAPHASRAEARARADVRAGAAHGVPGSRRAGSPDAGADGVVLHVRRRGGGRAERKRGGDHHQPAHVAVRSAAARCGPRLVPYVLLFSKETQQLFQDYPAVAGVRVITKVKGGPEVARALLTRTELSDVLSGGGRSTSRARRARAAPTSPASWTPSSDGAKSTRSTSTAPDTPAADVPPPAGSPKQNRKVPDHVPHHHGHSRRRHRPRSHRSHAARAEGRGRRAGVRRTPGGRRGARDAMGNPLPDETLDSIRENRIVAEGAADHAHGHRLPLHQRGHPEGVRPLRQRPPRAHHRARRPLRGHRPRPDPGEHRGAVRRGRALHRHGGRSPGRGRVGDDHHPLRRGAYQSLRLRIRPEARAGRR